LELKMDYLSITRCHVKDIMKFPITRECLQAYDFAKYQAERTEEEIQKRFAQILDQLCDGFQQSMPSNIREKKFVWRQLQYIKQMSPGLISDEYIPRFIEKLKETFIGCDIIVDPLKTYLIIEWT